MRNRKEKRFNQRTKKRRPSPGSQAGEGLLFGYREASAPRGSGELGTGDMWSTHQKRGKRPPSLLSDDEKAVSRQSRDRLWDGEKGHPARDRMAPGPENGGEPDPGGYRKSPKGDHHEGAIHPVGQSQRVPGGATSVRPGRMPFLGPANRWEAIRRGRWDRRDLRGGPEGSSGKESDLPAHKMQTKERGLSQGENSVSSMEVWRRTDLGDWGEESDPIPPPPM